MSEERAVEAARQLEALALRCEREGPSRELDAAILGVKIEPILNGTAHAIRFPDGRWGTFLDLPKYTTSLDAAVTLVPEDYTQWAVATKKNVPRPCVAQVNEGSWHEGRTLPLALCAAALRARAALAKVEK